MMAEKQVPQCQARLKNHERCSNRASRVMVGHNYMPAFVCGIHAKNEKLPTYPYLVKDSVRVDLLPDSLLDDFLSVAKECQSELGDEAYYAQRRYQQSISLVRNAEELVRQRKQQAFLDSLPTTPMSQKERA